jgi:hypothetical protein
MKVKLLILSFAVFICGCFGSPTKIAMVSEEDLKDVGTIELCAAYGDKLFGLEKVKTELKARLDLLRRGPADVIVLSDKEIVVLYKDKPGDKPGLPDKGKIFEAPKRNSKDLADLVEIKRNEESPPDIWEWELIEKGEIKNGMTQCGLLASWGMPTHIVRRSRRVDEWIYDRSSWYGSVWYGSVHVKKGRIKKWKR